MSGHLEFRPVPSLLRDDWCQDCQATTTFVGYNEEAGADWSCNTCGECLRCAECGYEARTDEDGVVRCQRETDEYRLWGD